MNTINFRYRFTLPDGRQSTFDVRLDAVTLDLARPASGPHPAWTALDFEQCPHCPLACKTHPHCPLASCLADVVDACQALVSYDTFSFEVTTQERVISGQTTAQRGISSLMGLLGATSGCPHTEFFKPMARFHLPLSSDEETIYRAASAFLLLQYFRRKNGQAADLDLKGLQGIYRNIHRVNEAMAGRLRAAAREDSSLNALILLDYFAVLLPDSIESSLKDIRYLFDPLMR